jgi:hypothetical protein
MSSSRAKQSPPSGSRSHVTSTRRRDDKRAVVSMPREVHQRLREVLDQVAHQGWSAFGIDRHDPPSLGAIIDEGINQLLERVKRSKP